MTILTAKGIHVSVSGCQGEISLLRDFSLSLDAGEILGLTGPSGAGKSLAALALCGLLDPPLVWTAGRIVLDGQVMTPWNPQCWKGRRGRGIFLIFQSPGSALNPSLKIATQMGEALTLVRGLPAAEARTEVRRLLKEVGLPADTGDDYPFQLSGGMRQRVMIAIALGLRPKVVVADEPTSGLDPIFQSEVLRAMRRLPEELGTALVILSHDLRLFGRLAHRIGVLHGGRLVELEETEKLLRAPGHPWTRRMIESLTALRSGHDAPAVH